MNDFVKQYEEYLNLIESSLDYYLPQSLKEWGNGEIPGDLSSAMRYSLLSGGKRLRPVMLLAAFHMLSDHVSEALPFAAAVEMIHTYSLVHDDLPAMDNDDMRRGKPSNHKKFGEGVAILVGDALLTHAFEIMASSSHPHALKAIHTIAKHAGASGMIAGQMADLAMEEKKPDMDMVYYIQRHKTSDLFTAAITAGLALGNADESLLHAGKEYALHFGLAFQITDDILDVEGDDATLGKSTGKDQSSGKMTWPGTVGLCQAKKDAGEHIQLAIQAAKNFGDNGNFFTTLARQIADRVK